VAAECPGRCAARREKLSVGPGLEEGTDLGPLVNEDTRSKVATLVAEAADTGGQVVTGGRAPDRRGYYYLPTVLGVPASSAILGTEIFGPVAPVARFTDEAGGTPRANDHEH